jgi:hypothetical protein
MAAKQGLYPASLRGAIAQLGERLNGIQEVVGSIPIGSTSKTLKRHTIPLLNRKLWELPWKMSAPCPQIGRVCVRFC